MGEGDENTEAHGTVVLPKLSKWGYVRITCLKLCSKAFAAGRIESNFATIFNIIFNPCDRVLCARTLSQHSYSAVSQAYLWHWYVWWWFRFYRELFRPIAAPSPLAP